MTKPAPSPVHTSERVVLTPSEFASILGRHSTWAYRMIEAGRVKVISKLGRMMIPRSEVDRLLQAKEINLGNKEKRGKRDVIAQAHRPADSARSGVEISRA